MNKQLQLTQINKSFKKQEQVPVLQGVDLEICSGEFVIIKGSSGCGKTTLLLTAGGLLRPDSGTVSFDGTNIYDIALNRRTQLRSKHIGFVFQRFCLIPYLSVLENIMVSGRVTSADAEKLIERLQLTSRMQHLPSELSVGEQQRTALARALCAKPAILLADEPTGNLDEINRNLIMQELSEYINQGGAVCMVTHENTAFEHVNRIFTLDNGILQETSS